jgi:hypothetical protein
MEMYGGMEVNIHAFLTSPAIPWESPLPVTESISCEPESSPEREKRKKKPTSVGNRNPVPSWTEL